MFRDIQTLVDPGDPINHICDAQTVKPLHLSRSYGDTVVPNSATDRLMQCGQLKKVSALGPNAVGPKAPALYGIHGRLARLAVRPDGEPCGDCGNADAVQ